MEALQFRPFWGVATLAACLCPSMSYAQMMWAPQPVMIQQPVVQRGPMPSGGRLAARSQNVAHSQNFIVFASSPEWAQQVADVAERNRRELAMHWLGKELPPWSERCPIHVSSGPNLGAGGETRFALLGHGAGDWMMSVQGTQERVLDSVLPHEITHTIFATHFAKLNKYVPRWADEGACTTVEHEAEKRKHRHYLTQFLQTGRGLAFNRMFRLKEYPSDILPLYAQGHSAVQFLIDQSSPREFITFIEQGMRTDDWTGALRQHYQYESIGEFQMSWNKWLLDGSPDDLISYAPRLQRGNAVALLAGSKTLPTTEARANLDDKVKNAIGDNKPAPMHLVGTTTNTARGGYYQQRLRAIQQGQPTDAADNDASKEHRQGEMSGNQNRAFPSVNTPASTPLADRQVAEASVLPSTSHAPSGRLHSLGRQQGSQSASIQVLDWGSTGPVRGIQSTAAQSRMVPIPR